MNNSSITRLVAVTAALALGVVTGGATPASARTASDDGSRCTDYGKVLKAPKGTIPRDDLQVVRKDPLARRLGKRPGLAAQAEQAGPVTIPVVFHVIRKEKGNVGGDLSDERIAEQIEVLNDAFTGTDFSFELVDTTRTTQPEWFNLIGANGDDHRLFRGSGKEIKMKKALHEGDSETLNIYSASLGQFLLGWAYLPWHFDGSDGEPLPRFFDGVVIDFRSLPTVEGDTGDDRAFTNYGEGDTATHEVGHWLGLYHTFQNGCDEYDATGGDQVADTAPEASPAFQCPTGRDTCTADAEPDPIHNFMDYTYDICMYEFTPGQAVRMQQTWTAYRELG
jgi:hypothetical protein